MIRTYLTLDVAAERRLSDLQESPQTATSSALTYLSIEELREVLEGVGYSKFVALEEKNKGWFAVKCKKQEGAAA